MISVTDSRNIGQMLRRRPSSAPPLVPIGSGSRLSVLPETVEKLDLSPLRTLEKLDRDELVVTAEAATPLGEVSAAAAECGAILCPLIPLKSPGTLGGLYVDGLESPLAPVEGPTRHAVLGVEGFTGNGDPIKSGGLVVKNVTGYDLTRFLAGSKGTLAVVTRIHWRLRRAPAALRELTYRFCPTELEEQLVRLRMAPDAAGVRLEAVKDELKTATTPRGINSRGRSEKSRHLRGLGRTGSPTRTSSRGFRIGRLVPIGVTGRPHLQWSGSDQRDTINTWVDRSSPRVAR